MLKKFCFTKGQGVSAEYVLMIALISIAIVGMTVYVRRTLQGRYRDGNRQIYLRAMSVLNTSIQPEYEPYYVETTADVDVATLIQESAGANGSTRRVNVLDRSVNAVSIQRPF